MTRQLVAVVERTGQAFGLVLDTRPMTTAQAMLHLMDGGVRCRLDMESHARTLSRRYKSDVTVSELVHHPGHVGHAGRRVRVYRPRTHYRVLVRVTIEAAEAA